MPDSYAFNNYSGKINLQYTFFVWKSRLSGSKNLLKNFNLMKLEKFCIRVFSHKYYLKSVVIIKTCFFHSFFCFCTENTIIFDALYRKHYPKQTSNHCISITFLSFKLTLRLQLLTEFNAVCSKLFRMTEIFSYRRIFEILKVYMKKKMA